MLPGPYVNVIDSSNLQAPQFRTAVQFFSSILVVFPFIPVIPVILPLYNAVFLFNNIITRKAAPVLIITTVMVVAYVLQ